MFGQYEQLDKLKADRAELEHKILSIEAELKKGLNRDKDEQAIQLENYEVLIEILRVSQSEINEINKKIYQIEKSSD